MVAEITGPSNSGGSTGGTSDPSLADSNTVSTNQTRFAAIQRSQGTGVEVGGSPGGFHAPNIRGVYGIEPDITTTSTSTSASTSSTPTPPLSAPPSPPQPSQPQSRNNNSWVNDLTRVVSAPFRAVGDTVRGIGNGLLEGAKKLPVVGPVVSFVQNAANKVKSFFKKLF